MSPGKRRLTAPGSALAALGLLVGVGLYWGRSDTGVEAMAMAVVEAEALGAPEEARVVVAVADAGLTREVRRIVNSSIAKAGALGADSEACHVSVLVQELGVAGPLVEMEADRGVRPASNLKLATTVVALTLLGAQANFETRFESRAPPVGGVLEGDLVVRAGADPLFREELNGACAPILAPWIEDLRAAGVRSVSGDLVLDCGGYVEPGPGPGWPSPEQRWTDYCALAGGFSANGGCVSILVEATRVGQPGRVRVLPAGHGARVEVDVRTGRKGSSLDLKAVVFADRIRVWGVIPADVRSWEGRYAHPDPVALFGSVLEHALREGGVLVSGVRRRERDAPGAHVLACLRSSIVSVLGPINTHSNNAVADQLFYKLGADVGGGGDRSGGARATLAAMAELGLDPVGFCQVDGSGLSRENRITARQMVCLIDAVIAPDDDGARAFMGSLALSGRTGTLEDRMRGTAAEGRVRAKSGFIGGTSALSGVVLCEGARILVFSILVEYPVVSGLNTDVWKPMQDSICEALARSG